MYIRVAVFTPLRRLFDYQTNEQVHPGCRVIVPFGRRHAMGVVVEKNCQPACSPKDIKLIETILDEHPIFSEEIFTLCQWAADYYQHPLGDVFSTALPKKLRQEKPPKPAKPAALNEQTIQPLLKLNDAQTKAFHAIYQAKNKFKPFLLDGVTGSGKTEVYLHCIAKVIEQHQQALIIIPEIGLTPQLQTRFENHFGNICSILHSGLNDTERLHAWKKAKTGESKIIIGTRSSIFVPFDCLGIIIVDEEHDASLKQQDGFRYSARDLAIVRAKNNNIPVVLGSATPSLETLYNVEKKKYTQLVLPSRAIAEKPPAIKLIDLRGQYAEDGLSNELLKNIETTLAKQEQVLLFLNRRGFSPSLVCSACGWSAQCQRCELPLTYHKLKAHLHCHHCDTIKPTPKHCPECLSKQIITLGFGTERIEESLKQHFPQYPVTRIDRDTTRKKHALKSLLSQINTQTPQILLGTQMLAKGHHFPNVTLVGVINIDSGLLSSDFKALERTAQLLVQVAGRAGRAKKAGTVYIQTLNPEQHDLHLLLKKGYHALMAEQLKLREQATLPPASYCVLVRAIANKIETTENFLTTCKEMLQQIDRTIFTHGPFPAPIAKKAGKYHMQLVLLAKHRSILHTAVKSMISKLEQSTSTRQVRWSVDVDPYDFS